MFARGSSVSAHGARVIQFPARYQDGQQWEPWLDERAIALHFGVSTRTVRRWRVEGLPSKLLGASRRFRLSEVEHWHAERSAS
jgi:hypothetical protein